MEIRAALDALKDSIVSAAMDMNYRVLINQPKAVSALPSYTITGDTTLYVSRSRYTMLCEARPRGQADVRPVDFN